MTRTLRDRAARTLALLASSILLLGLASCRDPNAASMDARAPAADVVRRDVALDRREAATPSMPDASVPDDAASRRWPWFEAIGTDRILIHPAEQRVDPTAGTCLDHPNTGVFMGGNYYSNSCRVGDWYYASIDGVVYRTNVRTGVGQVLAGPLPESPDHLSAEVACAGDRVVLWFNQVYSNEPVYEIRRAGLAIFDNFETPGQIVWQVSYPRRLPRVGGWGAYRSAASTQLIVWSVIPEQGPTQLWVSGPNGESPRQLPALRPDGGGVPVEQIIADGPNVLFSTGSAVYHWRIGATSYRMLNAPDTVAQRPWIHGRYAVWVGAVVGAVDDAGLPVPRNNEIYLHDLQTSTTQIISRDPPGRPTGQNYPTVFEDWVAYSDFRNASDPQPGANFTARMEILGYHIPTGTTVPVLTGRIQAAVSRFFGDGRLFVECRDMGDGAGQMRSVSLPMPTLPDL